jgi:hypothetical protein
LVRIWEKARHIAAELVKLYHAGAISGPDDRSAVFYAHLLRDFDATYTGWRRRGKRGISGGPCP